MQEVPVAVLASGRGSNLEALIERANHYKVVAVVCNVPGARCIEVARAHEIPHFVIPHKGLKRETHEREIMKALAPYNPQMLVLAGYMRIITGTLLRRYPKILNIHPAEPILYQGMYGYEFTLGLLPETDRREWATVVVHFVDEGVDTGEVISIVTFRVTKTDTLETLREKGLMVEHSIYPTVVRMVASRLIEEPNGE